MCGSVCCVSVCCLCVSGHEPNPIVCYLVTAGRQKKEGSLPPVTMWLMNTKQIEDRSIHAFMQDVAATHLLKLSMFLFLALLET